MRRNTAWAFAGNSVYAGCQWVVFVLLVKTLKVEEAGAFAYATAVTGPIFVLANVRLRILAGDRYRIARRLFGLFERTPADDGCSGLDVARHRRCGLAAGVDRSACWRSWRWAGRVMPCRTSAMGSFSARWTCAAPRLASRSTVCSASRSSDSRSCSRLRCCSRPLRTRSGSFIALSAWDLPRAARLHDGGGPVALADGARRRSAMRSAWRLITTGLPLGLSSAIGSVQTNVPRYVIASYLGPAMLARFAAISYITMIGHLVVNATSQAALPILARDAQTSGSRYQTQLGSLVAGTIVLGALLLIAAVRIRAAGARVRVREGVCGLRGCAALARRCDGRDVRIGLSRYWHGRTSSLWFAISHQHDVPRPRRGQLRRRWSADTGSRAPPGPSSRERLSSSPRMRPSHSGISRARQRRYPVSSWTRSPAGSDHDERT